MIRNDKDIRDNKHNKDTDPVPCCLKSDPVPVSAERMASKQYRYDLGDHKKCSLCDHWRRYMPAVLCQETVRPSIWSTVAVYPAVICILYSGGCSCRCGACSGYVDAS